MSKKTLIIDATNFSDLEGFYNEIDNVLTSGLDWKTGHNLDAFNDLLRGGFGVHDYSEPIYLIWSGAEKSKVDLQEKRNGQTLYETLVEIISEHGHITFIESSTYGSSL
jgi:RNAse (barnase) inhibitor barstar